MNKRMGSVKKTVTFILALIMLLVLPAGCAPAAGQSMTGGIDKPAENINLKDIDISVSSDETVVTLSLLSGSRAAGYPETKLTKLPAYEITTLSQPYRLKISLSGISFWDYEQKSTWDMTGLVSGLFREVPANYDSLIVYVQLSQEAQYDVKEDEGNLIVTLKPGAQSGSNAYYCVADAFYEHQEGLWPESIDMTPVLCTDNQNKLLISQPFPTQAAAESYQKQITDELAKSLPDKTVSVIQLAAGALPDYVADIDYSSAEGRSVLLKDGVLMNTPIVLSNGRYLASSPDGTIAFSRIYQPGESTAEQDAYLTSEKLWIMDPNGRIQNVDTPEFFYIDNAAYSFDGRYLALLDVSIDNRVLYLYDFSVGKLYNMGEEGLGSQTSSFAWSDTEDTLYAMSGNDSMQLHICTFADDGSFKIGGMEEQAGDEGNLAVSGKRVFFANSVAEKVYEIGSVRYEMGSGMDVKVSPDGKKLLILDAKADTDDQVLTDLKLYDIETDKTSTIVNNARIVDFCFGGDGKVYYTNEAVQQPSDGYPYGLYACDIEIGGSPELVALCSTSDMSASQGKLYFIEYIGEGDNGFYATYVYDPNA
jgi:Tol biopolymer transport system component